MPISRWLRLAALLPVLAIVVPPVAAQDDPMRQAPIRQFVGDDLGEAHPDAPAELSQFGRLVGLWKGTVEVLRQDGSWQAEPPSYWAWKYTLGGFAVTDLWFQPEEALPGYLGDLGRDYVLSAVRMYDPAAGHWRIAWMANGMGDTPGQDFGTMTAQAEEGRLVLSGPPDGPAGLQRVIFSEITDETFEWRSDYSQDGGETWTTVMKVHASRLR